MVFIERLYLDTSGRFYCTLLCCTLVRVSFRNFRKGGKCRVVPTVGGHGRCAGRSLEGGVGEKFGLLGPQRSHFTPSELN